MTEMTIEPTPSTPRVELRADARRLSVEGDCYPENPAAFFAPLIEAVQRTVARIPGSSFQAFFRLRYVNSSSSKALRRIFVLLDEAGSRGEAVSVTWEHDRDDDDSPELAGLLAEDLRFLSLEVRAA